MSIITEILKRPSQRTQLEATLAGLSVLLLTSIITPIYIIFFSEGSNWIKLLSGIGGIGLFLVMFSNLAMTYMQYYTFKMSMGMYSPDQKLLIKLEDAKQIKQELDTIIKEVELEIPTKLKGGKR